MTPTMLMNALYETPHGTGVLALVSLSKPLTCYLHCYLKQFVWTSI